MLLQSGGIIMQVVKLIENIKRNITFINEKINAQAYTLQPLDNILPIKKLMLNANVTLIETRYLICEMRTFGIEVLETADNTKSEVINLLNNNGYKNKKQIAEISCNGNYLIMKESLNGKITRKSTFLKTSNDIVLLSASLYKDSCVDEISYNKSCVEYLYGRKNGNLQNSAEFFISIDSINGITRFLKGITDYNDNTNLSRVDKCLVFCNGGKFAAAFDVVDNSVYSKTQKSILFDRKQGGIVEYLEDTLEFSDKFTFVSNLLDYKNGLPDKCEINFKITTPKQLKLSDFLRSASFLI